MFPSTPTIKEDNYVDLKREKSNIFLNIMYT